MDPWQKETLGLQVGDFINWRDEAIELEGQPVAPWHEGRGHLAARRFSFGCRRGRTDSAQSYRAI